jgi:DNA-directed RNA polymerase sigma subunit (sigma70/sigma32)
MEVVFQFAFDEEQDFSRGFAIHHLRYVDTSDVRAIKYLDYKHVLFAIEEIQKISENVQYLDLPSIDDSEPINLDSSVYSFSIYDDLIRKASNIEDLVEAILNRLDAEKPMSERDRAVLSARADWITSNPQTLDAIGHDYGLTRERS